MWGVSGLDYQGGPSLGYSGSKDCLTTHVRHFLQTRGVGGFRKQALTRDRQRFGDLETGQRPQHVWRS